ncbi:L-ascorbate metabolism protein UlaG (beta-lactamase superfamily) [Streptomyces sp. 1114.5]|uniref:MBL fold metallo-hydrolase n=1 Tax=unclassified Streptomyces TaxID=2593676 RepID=UPI000BD56FC5|nr:MULTISPECIES: MBL fold metallo-hydrolase [unclassified Streptomyces]RKT18515.1 L-ascorbate metabolism protein UlaG (beta-lactamase superfamily) [Streptomyces sp. 1114.5]SOB84715.1 L-ascorbate metabolism protein UlaG, beta-lactamase superfamily [Streptomyces sp. 1331.2]
MRITKFGHACVRIEHGDTTVVVDPGAFTDPAALTGADAVLITHEHMDHFEESRLRAALEADPALRVWTNSAVAAQLDGVAQRVSAVGEGDAFELGGPGGLAVSVHGEWHAEIHADIPLVKNIGFLFDGRLFHPGDAFTVPPHAVDTLLLPLAAPWSKAGEVVDYVREAGPRVAVPVHEATLSPIGHMVATRLLGPDGPGTGAGLTVLGEGESLEVG